MFRATPSTLAKGREILRYKYFEKRRIFEGTEKSDDRLDNEDHYPSGVPIMDGRTKVIIGVEQAEWLGLV